MSSKREQVLKGVCAKWLSLLLCTASIAITAVLFWINFSERFWFPPSGIHFHNYASIKTTPTDVINGMQFAAKGYEILVVLCLGAMTVDVYKRHLVKEGVPYGLLTNAYQTSNIKLLIKPQFWKSAPKARWLATTVVVSVLLGTVAGPASAALIVPKLGLYQLPNAFSNIIMPLYTTSLTQDMWPQVLNKYTAISADFADNCNAFQGTFYPSCPAGGFSNIYSWVSGWMFSDLPNNITFPDPSGQVSRRLNLLTHNITGTFFSTPTAFTVSALGQFKSYLEQENAGPISDTEFYKLTLSNSTNYQPLVNAKCQVWNNKNFSDPTVPIMQVPYKDLNCFGDNTCMQMRDLTNGVRIPSQYWNYTGNISIAFSVMNQGNVSSTNASLSSLGFLGFFPYLNPNRTRGGVRIVACSYMAHWINSEYFVNSTDSEPMETDINDLSIFINQTSLKTEHPEVVFSDAIGFDETYLPYLALGSNISSSELADRNFETLGYLFQPLLDQDSEGAIYLRLGASEDDPSVGDAKVAEYIEKITGALVTDAIERTGADQNAIVAQKPTSNDTIYMIFLGSRNSDTRSEQILWNNGTLLDASGDYQTYNGTPQEYLEGQSLTINFEAKQYGYGYGLFSGSLIFAYVVLFFYVVIIITYWATTFLYQANTVAALSDLQELMLLAWRSHSPPELEGVSISDLQNPLWEETVAVKATSSKVLVLVVDKDRPEKSLSELIKEEEYL